MQSGVEILRSFQKQILLHGKCHSLTKCCLALQAITAIAILYISEVEIFLGCVKIINTKILIASWLIALSIIRCQGLLMPRKENRLDSSQVNCSYKGSEQAGRHKIDNSYLLRTIGASTVLHIE